MTLQEIYDLAIEMGMKADPRGADGVKRVLEKVKEEYELEKKSAKGGSASGRKKYFDKESFINPYSDSRILYGDPKIKVNKLLAGIDGDASEVLLADRLSDRGEKIDLVISHHPSGHALASLYEVMDIQVDLFAEAGVPVNVAHALFEERKAAVRRRLNPLNHTQSVDTARLLNIPLLSLHTIWDNLGHSFMKKHLGSRKFDLVDDVLDYINELPEFTEAIKGKNGPFVVAGSEKRKAGKIVVGFTGGTSPSKELYMELAKAGAGTIVEMHVPEESVEALKKLHINVIDCGHMAADSIGANLFLDEVGKRGISVIPCSGLIRVKRK